MHGRSGPRGPNHDGDLGSRRRRRRPRHRDRRRDVSGAQTMTHRRVAKGGTLILGGGFGGAHVARLVRDATIVSPESSMLYTPLLPEVAAGAVEPRHACVPLREMCPNAELVRGRVSALDELARTVTVETEIGDVDVSYRRLVIALGSTARMLPIPGLADHAMTFKDLADAIHLRNHVLRQLDLAEADPRNARRYLTFVFVGAGYAGVEALAELRQLVEDAVRHYPALRDARQRWVLVDAGPGILAEVPRPLADHTTAQLRRHGVEILTSSTVASVEARAVTLTDGRRLDTATLVWTAGVVPNPLLRTLGLPLDERGRIVVDSSLRVSRPLGHLGPRGLRRRTERRHARKARSAHLPARRAPGTRGGRVTRGRDRALRLPQHRRGRHPGPRPGSRAGVPPARARAAGRPDHARATTSMRCHCAPDACASSPTACCRPPSGATSPGTPSPTAPSSRAPASTAATPGRTSPPAAPGSSRSPCGRCRPPCRPGRRRPRRWRGSAG